jgi:hypothetical protein
MSDSQLRELWNFADADLGANRQGQLTEKQRKFLVGEHKSQRGVFLGVGVAVVVLFCCFPALLFGARGLLPMLISGGSADPVDMIQKYAFIIFGIIFFGITALVVGTVAAFFIMRANKKADIAVRHIEGVVTYTWGTKRVRTPGSSVRNYEDVRVLHLNLGDKKFEVQEQLQGMIQEGEEWTVYYTSDPFKFLSGELVPKEN